MSFCGVLRQSTAVDVLIGPFVDSTDGDSEETGLTIAQADVRLSKNGQTGAQKNDNTTCAHDADGFYNCELDATDTNTCGQLTLWVHVAGALAVRHDYQIVEEAVYDIHYAASATGAVPVASIANGAITAAVVATGAIDADALAADAGTELATAVWANATRTLSALDEDSTTLDLDATIRASVGLASANLDTQIGTLATAANLATVDTVVDAIKAKTDSLTFTTAGIVDANVQQINDVTITGDGQVGTEFGV